MAEITAQAVKELREKSGAGMMDCKKALTETKGDMEAAIDWLRKKGIVNAAKKADRVAAEGLVAIASSEDGKEAAMIELNSETDFVAKNEQFQKLAGEIAQTALKNNFNDVEALKNTATSYGKTVAEGITWAISSIGENLNLRKATKLKVGNGVIATYIHNAVVPGAGKIGVLVALESTAPQAKLKEIGRQIAMHVAAAKPEALAREEVKAENLERERNIFMEQARAAGKPEDVIKKMVDGRINKFYGEVVLPEQIFVLDGKSKVSDFLAAASKEAGAPIKLAGFKLYVLGEGIEVEQKDFAAEVAATVKAAS